MLDGAGNTAGNIESRRNRFSGLPDLGGMRTPSGIYSRTAGTDRTPQKLCELVKERKPFFATHPPATGNNNARFGDIPCVSAHHDAMSELAKAIH